jgi:hypothetical protein
MAGSGQQVDKRLDQQSPIEDREERAMNRRQPDAILIFLIVMAVSSSSVRAGNEALPYAPQYLGDIKRDANGQLIVVPPEHQQDQTEAPDNLAQDSSDHRTIIVGLDQAIHTPSAAAAVARDGDTVEIEAGVYVGDTAVWKQNNLTIRGIEGRPELQAGGKSAEGKAIWVVRGGNITIENIEFRDARVRDKNGAGIRFEQGNLTVRNCRFIHNENGILTGSGDMILRIENSEFGYNGYGDGYSHNLYAGHIKSLYVTGSYFHHANAGHLLKSRAEENHILFNRLTDETGGRASYEIDLPNGGQDYIVGNIIEQSATAQNPNIISFGEEGYQGTDSRLYLVQNTILNDRPGGGNLLLAKAGYDKIAVLNNVLIGKFDDSIEDTGANAQSGTKTKPANMGVESRSANHIEYRDNIHADRVDVADVSNYDLRPVQGRKLTSSKIASTYIDGIDLTPHYEYRHPRQLKPIQSAEYPGAIQTVFLP